MKKFYKMSDSEMEIMKVIWASTAPVTVAQLLSAFESRNWKTQTVTTFLTRLTEKGLLTAYREARTNFYVPVITPKDYRQLEAQSLLSSMYDGSVQNFLAALYSGGIDASEAEELKKWFEKAGENA